MYIPDHFHICMHSHEVYVYKHLTTGLWTNSFVYTYVFMGTWSIHALGLRTMEILAETLSISVSVSLCHAHAFMQIPRDTYAWTSRAKLVCAPVHSHLYIYRHPKGCPHIY